MIYGTLSYVNLCHIYIYTMNSPSRSDRCHLTMKKRCRLVHEIVIHPKKDPGKCVESPEIEV